MKKQVREASGDFLKAKQSLPLLSQDVLAYLKQKHVDQASVDFYVERGFEAHGRDRILEGVEHCHSHSMTVTVYRNHATGAVSTSDLRSDGWKEACDRAVGIAAYTESDPHQALADPKDMPKEIPDLHTYYAPLKDAAASVACIESMGAWIYDLDQRIHSVSDLSISSTESFYLHADSQGFLGGYPLSTYACSVGIVARDKEGAMQRDGDYTVDADPSRLVGWKTVASSAVDKAVRRLGARPVPTQTCPVLFDPSVSKSLISHFLSAIRGVALYQDQSFLKGMLGASVFSNNVHIAQHPLTPGLPGSRAFDGDGVRTVNRTLVEAGVLQSYLLGVYSGRRLGMHTTGNAAGPLNVQLRDDGLSQKDLIKKMDRGLLVTELMGQGVNAVTGDYSRGASGFWVENGVIQFPVDEVVLSGNLKDAFQNIHAVGDDRDMRGRIQVGSILAEGFTVAGVH